MTTLIEKQSNAVANRNTATAKLIYSHFLKGDIPALLALCSPNLVWSHGANAKIVPFGGAFEGISGVLRFFEAVTQAIQITRFEPHDFVAEGDRVTNRVHADATVKATGKSVSLLEWVVWTFDHDGRIIRYETLSDMSALENAFL